MKSLSILFLSFALMMFSKTNAQWYSPQKDNLIFKESKGHWQLPVTNYREVWSMKNVTMRLQCAPKPTIEFYIDLFDPYPWFDWKNAPAPSGNSGNKH